MSQRSTLLGITGDASFERGQFERASGGAHGPLGDSERWGGASSATAHLIRLVAFRSEVFGEQFIRVQTPDLLARSWDLTCQFNISGIGDGDIAIVGLLDVTWGAGQATGRGQLLCNVGPRPLIFPGDWDYDSSAVFGTFSIPHPIPASTLAVRPLLRVQSIPTTTRDVVLSVVATVSPRALA